MDLDSLLSRHCITRGEYDSTGLNFESIQAICNHHVEATSELESAGRYIADRLQGVSEVHSLKLRVKSPAHLAAKVIRKKLEKSDLTLTVETYESEITDLIGVRALHLFKNDWFQIHEFVKDKWELNETPTAYIRAGDPESLTRSFESADGVPKSVESR